MGTELHLLFELFEYKGQGLIPCVETLVLFSGSGFKFLNFVQGGPHKVSWSTVELTEDENIVTSKVGGKNGPVVAPSVCKLQVDDRAASSSCPSSGGNSKPPASGGNSKPHP